MLRIVRLKNGKEFKSYSDLHAEIIADNHINYCDVKAELIIEKGIIYNVLRPLPDKLQLARDTEALYKYGFIKEGD